MLNLTPDETSRESAQLVRDATACAELLSGSHATILINVRREDIDQIADICGCKVDLGEWYESHTGLGQRRLVTVAVRKAGVSVSFLSCDSRATDG